MVLSAKLRNRKLATPCTNYGTVGENMESGVLFVAYNAVKFVLALGKIKPCGFPGTPGGQAPLTKCEQKFE